MDYDIGKQFELLQAKLDAVLEKLYPEKVKKEEAEESVNKPIQRKP